MGYCVINRFKQQIAWCNNYDSAYRMSMQFGIDSVIFDTRRKIHHKFVAQIRKLW